MKKRSWVAPVLGLIPTLFVVWLLTSGKLAIEARQISETYPYISTVGAQVRLTAEWWYPQQDALAYAGPTERLGFGKVSGLILMLEVIDGQVFAVIEIDVPGASMEEVGIGQKIYKTKLSKAKGTKETLYVPLTSLWAYAWPDGTRVLIDKMDLGEFRSGEILLYEPSGFPDELGWPGLASPKK